MPTLDWLNRDAAFRIADAVPTRVLRPHAAGHRWGVDVRFGIHPVAGRMPGRMNVLLAEARCRGTYFACRILGAAR